jgi:hypothetical protein
VALAIDASTPVIAVNSSTTVATVTTASFTPPAGALLLIRWAGDTATSPPSAPSITDNLGVHLTYTLTDWQSSADSPTVNGQAATWWAVVGSSAAMTVTVTSGTASGHRASAVHVTVITGQDTVTPVGAHGKSGSASAATIAQTYTASATGGQGFIIETDWDALGTATAGTGCTTTNGGASTIAGQISYAFIRRTSADDSAGAGNTLNVTLPGTSTNLSWAYVEIKPAATVTDTPGRAVVLTATRPPAGPVSLVSQMRDVTPIAAIDTPPRAAIIATPRPGSGPVAITSRSTADPIGCPPQPSIVASPSPRRGPTFITTRSIADTPIAAGDSPARALVSATPPPRPIAVVITTRMAADPAVVVADTPPQTFVIAVPARRQSTPPIVLRPWVEEVGPDSTFVVAPQPPRGRGFLATFSTHTDADAWPNTLVVAPRTRLSAPAPILSSSRADPPVVVPGAAMPVAYVIAAPRTRSPGSMFSGQALLVADCHLPRPDTGDTSRPGAGLTARPTGATSRPGTGLTLRPDSGDTDNPC